MMYQLPTILSDIYLPMAAAQRAPAESSPNSPKHKAPGDSFDRQIRRSSSSTRSLMTPDKFPAFASALAPTVDAVHVEASTFSSKPRDVSPPLSPKLSRTSSACSIRETCAPIPCVYKATSASTSRTSFFDDADDLVPASSVPSGTSPVTIEYLAALQRVTQDYASDRKTWRVGFKAECARALSYVNAAPREEEKSVRAYRFVFHMLACDTPQAASRIFKGLDPGIAKKALCILALRLARELADYGDLAYVRQNRLPRAIDVPIHHVLQKSFRSVAKERKNAAHEVRETSLKKAVRRADEGLRALEFVSTDGSLWDRFDQLLDKMDLTAIRNLAPRPELTASVAPERYWNEYAT